MVTFEDCARACFQDKELLKEYDRLRGTNLSLRGTWLDTEIDFASGRMDKDMEEFVRWVKDEVWSRVPR